MTIGNLYLEYNGLVQNNDDLHYLRKAQRYFEESIHTIEELNKMNESDKDDDYEYKNRKRALLLCSGRAHTNLGKTHFELSEMIRKKQTQNAICHREYMSSLSLALKYFKVAEQEAEILRTQSIVADSSDKRAELHMIDAKVLVSLSCRFQGNAYLRLSKEKESIDALKKACGIEEHDMDTFSTEKRSEVAEATLWLMLERYDSSCSLIHMCCSLLDLAVRVTNDEMWNEKISDTLIEGYAYVAKLSDAIHNYFTHDNGLVKDVVAQHEVLRSDDILKLKEETINRLRNRKCSDKRSQLAAKRPSLPDLPRNDLFRNQNTLLDIQPRERIVIHDTQSNPPVSHTTRRRKVNIADDAFNNFGLDSSDNADFRSIDMMLTNTASSKRYRKWGDELLTENGMNVNIYPSTEPTRPEEMIRDLEKIR